MRFRRAWRWRCFWLDVDLSMVNLPRVAIDPERRWIALSWGNRWSDPVWMLQIGPRS